MFARFRSSLAVLKECKRSVIFGLLAQLLCSQNDKLEHGSSAVL